MQIYSHKMTGDGSVAFLTCPYRCGVHQLLLKMKTMFTLITQWASFMNKPSCLSHSFRSCM